MIGVRNSRLHWLVRTELSLTLPRDASESRKLFEPTSSMFVRLQWITRYSQHLVINLRVFANRELELSEVRFDV
jgi:hypothetical protein